MKKKQPPRSSLQRVCSEKAVFFCFPNDFLKLVEQPSLAVSAVLPLLNNNYTAYKTNQYLVSRCMTYQYITR